MGSQKQPGSIGNNRECCKIKLKKFGLSIETVEHRSLAEKLPVALSAIWLLLYNLRNVILRSVHRDKAFSMDSPRYENHEVPSPHS